MRSFTPRKRSSDFIQRLLVILFTTEGKESTEEEIKVKGFHQYKLFFSV